VSSFGTPPAAAEPESDVPSFDCRIPPADHPTEAFCEP
jgi:hypothetical protein